MVVYYLNALWRYLDEMPYKKQSTTNYEPFLKYVILPRISYILCIFPSVESHCTAKLIIHPYSRTFSIIKNSESQYVHFACQVNYISSSNFQSTSSSTLCFSYNAMTFLRNNKKKCSWLFNDKNFFYVSQEPMGHDV